jgi:hypothetical protein
MAEPTTYELANYYLEKAWQEKDPIVRRMYLAQLCSLLWLEPVGNE